MTGVPFVDLAAVHEPVLAELRDAFERVVATSAFIGGQEVERFEHSLAEAVGVRHAVGVGSGTAALHLALVAGGVGAGDEVLVPANTFVATVEAVVASGARPVLVDVDRATALLDLDAAEAAITSRTAAVIPVHLYGQPVDAGALRDLASRHSLFVLEDAAQAIGATWDGQPAGSLGSAAAFSFYPGKNLGALGDAGAVTTDDDELARRVRLLRSHGEETRHHHVVSGLCERLDGLQAAFLDVKLRHLADAQATRDAAAAHYREILTGREDIVLFSTPPEARHVHHLFVVRVPDRDRVLADLREAGIEAAVHYPRPIHAQPAFADLGTSGQFPVAEALTASVLSLPLYAGISTGDLDRCATALFDALRSH
jgi:dTDP-4-amino-4,6-dideoxygalactose transaminase